MHYACVVIRRALVAGFVALLATSTSALANDKGMLSIVTEPGDAKIFIDGTHKGNSPAEPGQSFTIKLDEGEYTVSAIKSPDGGQEQFAEKMVFVADDTMQTITLKLADRAPAEQAPATTGYMPNPEMVAIKAGSFRMGCLESDKKCLSDAKPVLDMNVAAFEIGKYEVTFEMWDACFAQGGCKHLPSDDGRGRGQRPVMNVSWNDIQEFLAWINQKTGKNYRLPTEPEWEYAARAGTVTVYSWGDEVGKDHANCAGCGSQWDNKQTAPVGSFAANPWGVHDMHGNVREWVDGCPWSYKAVSTQASDWKYPGKCTPDRRVLRGGSWLSIPSYVRAASRDDATPEDRNRFNGFRLAMSN
ncbi:MAG: hypothetical protein BWK76_06410 [Desulfobulbaceae bacterium A2]|nr:MAG: hypothetical protein BWK76_06410 [Desulfobulbaceae bacterium A2]